MTVRDSFARINTGGPQFRIQPEKLIVELEGQRSLTAVLEEAVDGTRDILEQQPVSSQIISEVRSKFKALGFETKELRNLGLLVVETDNLQQVLDNIINEVNEFTSDTVNRIKQVMSRVESKRDNVTLSTMRAGNLNFSQRKDIELDAKLHNELMNLNLKNELTNALEDIDDVLNVEMNFTRSTPGPRSLNIDVTSGVRHITSSDESDKPNMGDVLDKLGVPKAWEIDTGQNAVAAIFDVSFCEDRFQEDRVLGAFHGEGFDTVYDNLGDERKALGHGTMSAYCMAGNKEGHDLSYHGVAKDADLLLAKTADENGDISLIAEAWDWLVGWVKKLDRPVISNHSYGIPLCSGRGMDACSSTITKTAKALNKRPDHQAFYAAGNEANYCGHRLIGVTNGISGANSDSTSLTSAAFRYDLLDAQFYSSHGFGTCSDTEENPKPDFGTLIPTIVPYGCDEKDMSTSVGGSGAGTSCASPIVAGVATLLASAGDTAKRADIEQALEETAKQVRPTQINLIKNHDARFGNGQVDAGKAIEKFTLETQEEDSDSSGFDDITLPFGVLD